MVSPGGQISLLGKSPISWHTFKQKSISLSTMESEFIAITEAAREMVWLGHIFEECVSVHIVRESLPPYVLYSDNQAAIEFSSSPIENHRSKHINVRYFFVRDLVYKGVFDLRYVRSKDNLADPFTKAITKHDLMQFNERIFSMIED